jgi:hypothetical protein
MSSLLAALLLATELGGLSLTISSPQSEVLVGEPLRITCRWRASALVKGIAIEESDFLFQSILLSVDDGKGARLFREYQHEMAERALVRHSLKQGEERVFDLVFYQGGYVDHPGGQPHDALLFSSASEYLVRAIYVHDGAPSMVVSNQLRFKVAEPKGAERAILDQLRKDRTLVTADGSPQSRAVVRDLLVRSPDSPYLRLAKLELFRQRHNALYNEYDPDTGASIQHLGPEGIGSFRREYYRRMSREVLAEDWGPYADEALALAALYAWGAGDRETSLRLKKDLLERYPQSVPARQIKEAETKPTDRP